MIKLKKDALEERTMNSVTQICAEARGRARQLYRDLTPIAERVRRVIGTKRFRDLTDELVYRSSPKGVARALVRLHAMHNAELTFPPTARRRAAAWRFLQPLDAVVEPDPADPGLSQGSVGVFYLLAGALGEDRQHITSAIGPWALSVSDHALGRVYERTPGIDVPTLIMAAHTRLLAADPEDMLRGHRNFFLPVGGAGAFACTLALVNCRDGREEPWVYARTWLDVNMLDDERNRMIRMSSDNPAMLSILSPSALWHLEESR
jgi:hypothetical protein